MTVASMGVLFGAAPFLPGTASSVAVVPDTAIRPGAAPTPGHTAGAARAPRPVHIAGSMRPATAAHTLTPAHTTAPAGPATADVPEAPEEEATAEESAQPEETAAPGETAHKIRSVTRVCRQKSYYTIGFHRHRDLFVPHTHFIDGPTPAGGAEMKAIVARTHVIDLDMELELEQEREFSVKDLVVKARKMVSPEISESHTVQVGHEYMVRPTKGMYGHLRYRVFGYRVDFQRWKVFSGCERLKVVSGVADFPTAREGWKYWETRHA